MKFLLPGSLALAMFVSVMIGGGMLYIDDKARGVHEGYLVTPITKLELVLGLNLAGAMDFPTAGRVVLDGVCTSGLPDADLTRLRRSKVGDVVEVTVQRDAKPLKASVKLEQRR